MKQGIKQLYETGGKDAWGREILKDRNEVSYKLVDGIPHTVTKTGEPDCPLDNYNIILATEQLEYDPKDYPDGFAPELYDLEQKPWKESSGLTL